MGALRSLLLLLVLVCAISVGIWVTHGDSRSVDRAATPAGRPSAEPIADTPGGIVHLVVLNGTAVANLAGDFSLLVGRAGCVADRIDNAPHDHFAESLLINRRLSDAQAAALAARFGGPRILREFAEDTTEDAVLVIGADHARLRGALLGD